MEGSETEKSPRDPEFKDVCPKVSSKIENDTLKPEDGRYETRKSKRRRTSSEMDNDATKLVVGKTSKDRNDKTKESVDLGVEVDGKSAKEGEEKVERKGAIALEELLNNCANEIAVGVEHHLPSEGESVIDEEEELDEEVEEEEDVEEESQKDDVEGDVGELSSLAEREEEVEDIEEEDDEVEEEEEEGEVEEEEVEDEEEKGDDELDKDEVKDGKKLVVEGKSADENRKCMQKKKRSRNQLSSSSDSDPTLDSSKKLGETKKESSKTNGKREECASLEIDKNNYDEGEEEEEEEIVLRLEGIEAASSPLSRRESVSELEEMEDSSSPRRRDFETTETETDESDQEDFPTEGLLKELHFLNASCERPSFSQSYRTPKKQKRSDVRGSEGSRSSTPVDKKAKRKISPLKRMKNSTESDGDTKLKEAQTPMSVLSVSPSKTNTDDEETEDSDEGSLQIVAEEENLKKRKTSTPQRMRKKMRTVDPSDVPLEVIELIQSGIDEVLEEKAERTHLTAIHVKNIIKNVMTDENVVAMVRNTVLGINTTDAESSAVYEPTLTRAKTKEIIQQQAEGTGKRSIWAELSKTNTMSDADINPETRALVTTDFPDEDEDDEYTPDADEHMHSGDESFVSGCVSSTLGSPSSTFTPTTPLSTCTPSSQLSVATPHSNSDLTSPMQPPDKRIQLLKQKSAQRVLDFEQPLKKEELVSQRTRSKLPLTGTSLECLEMAFKPPDVTDDMYESEVLDDDWKTFLIDFIRPLETNEGAEDEEADPEYNILEDKEDANDLREEMRGDRAVQISKKEINDLLGELLGTLDSDEEATEPVRKHFSQHINTQKKKPPPPKIVEPDKVTDDGSGPPSNTIWVEVITAKFLPHQLDILRQQMAQHTQLLATTVLMCDVLPGSTVPGSATALLEEMKNTSTISESKSTFFQPFNLDAALDTLKRFKEKNPDPPPKVEPRKTYTLVELNQRVTEAILESSAFPFPQLLPRRMFSEPTASTKAFFVPSEDMLVVMGLINHLFPENQSEKTVKKLPAQLHSALQEGLKDRVIHKTVHQIHTRVKNMRRRMKEHISNKNPLAIFLNTGKITLPSANVEPLLPFVPCLVQDYPEDVLRDPWKKIVSKKKEFFKKEAEKSSAEQKLLTKELSFGGLRPIQKSVQKMIIISSGSTNTQVLLPTTLAAIAPMPPPLAPVVTSAVSSMTFLPAELPQISSLPIVSTNVSTSVAAYPMACMMPNTIPIINAPLPPVLEPETIPNASSSSGSTLKSKSTASGIKTESLAAEEKVAGVSVNVGPSLSSRKKKLSSSLPYSPPADEQPLADGPPASSFLDGEQLLSKKDSDASSEVPTKKNPGSEETDASALESDEESYEITKEQAAMSEFMSSVGGPVLNYMDKGKSVTSPDDVVDIASSNALECPLETPQKSPPPSPVSIATPHLHMPSLLSTPERPLSAGKDLSKSMLDVPLVTFPFDQSPTGHRKLKVTALPPSSDVTASAKQKLVKSHDASQQVQKENDPPVNELQEKEAANNKVGDVSEGNQESLQNIKNGESEKESGKSANMLSGIGISHQVTNATLVTSVYQSPIPSSAVSGMENLRLVMNVSPQKTLSPYRKISPAKVLRSPIKTSPMKKVSPILRKYGYRQKIRPCSKKLSPILPKLTPQKPQRIRSAAQRRLAPKSTKESSSRPGSQVFSPSSGKSGNQLAQIDDELGTDNEASNDSSHTRTPKSETVHQSEEEFEEDYLEEEEEEEEEEDSEAAQQREEHLAALLKASSTIVGKKCDRLSGGDVGPAERRLNKQQRRLQARITALSIVQESLAKDKSMAQSYLMRVRDALTVKDPILYKKFLCILNEFTENASNSPVELYDQLCEVLKDFPLLKEEFVSFLLPQQAIAIGKYAQYCAIHRMRDFLDKLKLQFRKQPQHIQKVIRVLQSLQNRSDLDFENVKAVLCPLLRYPHLVESFCQCFASQPPPPSLPNDFEDITLERSHTPDSVENVVLPDDDPITSPDHCGCPCHSSGPSPPTAVSTNTAASGNAGRGDHCQSCAIRFSEGRVYLQYGKTLRPAKVTYHTVGSESGSGNKDKKASEGSSGRETKSASDGSEVMSKGKSAVPRKSQQKESGDSALTKNKENILNSASDPPDHKGAFYVGNKGSKDDALHHGSKQPSGRGRSDETDIAEDSSRVSNSSLRREGYVGRSSQSKRTSSSKNSEKESVVNQDNVSDVSNTLSKSNLQSSVSSKVRNVGNLEVDSSPVRTSKKSSVMSVSQKEVQDNTRTQNVHNLSSTAQVPTLSDTEEKKRFSESSFTAKRTKENATVPATGIKKESGFSISIGTPPVSGAADSFSHGMHLSNISNKKIEKNTNPCASALATPTARRCEWTRDEDKLILMTIQGRGTTDNIIQEILKVLPDRTNDEVLERFNFLVRLMMEEADMEDISLSSEDDTLRD